MNDRCMSKRPSLAESTKSAADEPLPALEAAAPKGRARSRLGKKLVLVPLDPRPLDLPETELLELMRDAIEKGVFTPTFIKGLRNLVS